MLKIKYPKDLKKLKDDYLSLFNLSEIESRWRPVERKHGIRVKDLLVGDFEFLVDKYLWYQTQAVSPKNEERYFDIFDYPAYQPKIAEFFMDKSNGFDIRTCHYCNMAYVNSYGKGQSYDTILDFINNATASEWREIFDDSVLPDKKLGQILSHVPFKNVEEFNKGKYLHKRIELYKGLTLNDDANHFDLDHILPKSKCPIVGLSLFNFVPSCQVCNEKLKKDKELAHTKDEWMKISPTYYDSRFDEEVTIKLVTEETCSTFFELASNEGKYHLDFITNGEKVYDNYVSILRLKDRYNYHKKLALHILDLKERYPEEKRREISSILSAKGEEGVENMYSERQIEEDIFQEDFFSDRCFSKLRRDMLHKN